MLDHPIKGLRLLAAVNENVTEEREIAPHVRPSTDAQQGLHCVTATWRGLSGLLYQFDVYDLNTPLPETGGNYIFTTFRHGVWHPLYIGETGSLRQRIGSGHERWECARRHRMKHVHIRPNSNPSSRRTTESDLLRQYDTPCNG